LTIVSIRIITKDSIGKKELKISYNSGEEMNKRCMILTSLIVAVGTIGHDLMAARGKVNPRGRVRSTQWEEAQLMRLIKKDVLKMNPAEYKAWKIEARKLLISAPLDFRLVDELIEKKETAALNALEILDKEITVLEEKAATTSEASDFKTLDTLEKQAHKIVMQAEDQRLFLNVDSPIYEEMLSAQKSVKETAASIRRTLLRYINEEKKEIESFMAITAYEYGEEGVTAVPKPELKRKNDSLVSLKNLVGADEKQEEKKNDEVQIALEKQEEKQKQAEQIALEDVKKKVGEELDRLIELNNELAGRARKILAMLDKISNVPANEVKNQVMRYQDNIDGNYKDLRLVENDLNDQNVRAEQMTRGLKSLQMGPINSEIEKISKGLDAALGQAITIKEDFEREAQEEVVSTERVPTTEATVPETTATTAETTEQTEEQAPVVVMTAEETKEKIEKGVAEIAQKVKEQVAKFKEAYGNTAGMMSLFASAVTKEKEQKAKDDVNAAAQELVSLYADGRAIWDKAPDSYGRPFFAVITKDIFHPIIAQLAVFKERFGNSYGKLFDNFGGTKGDLFGTIDDKIEAL